MAAKYRAWIDSRLLLEGEDGGLGQVIIGRSKSGGRIELGIFLLDPWCLGVRDGFVHLVDDEDELQEFLERVFPAGREERSPAWLRKYVEGAVDYSRKLGFAPARDYKKAARVFGGIDSKDCLEQIEYGFQGQPYYVQGMLHDDKTADRIIAKLKHVCGENFRFLRVSDEELADLGNLDLDDLDDADLDDPDYDPDEELSDLLGAGLQSLRAEQSGGGKIEPELEQMEQQLKDLGKGWTIAYDDDSHEVADLILKLSREMAEGIGSVYPDVDPEFLLQTAAGIIGCGINGSTMTAADQTVYQELIETKGAPGSLVQAIVDKTLHEHIANVSSPAPGITRRILQALLNDESGKLFIIYGEIDNAGDE